MSSHDLHAGAQDAQSVPPRAQVETHRRILLVVTRAQQTTPLDTVEYMVVEPLTESEPPMRREDRQLDELEVPAYPVGSDIGWKRFIRKIGPVLPAMANVAPAESHQRGVIERYAETESVAGGVTLKEIRAPQLVLVEVTKDRVVARPDMLSEIQSITALNQLDLVHCGSAVRHRDTHRR